MITYQQPEQHESVKPNETLAERSPTTKRMKQEEVHAGP